MGQSLLDDSDDDSMNDGLGDMEDDDDDDDDTVNAVRADKNSARVRFIAIEYLYQ